jgi:hypothetical protein
MPVTFLTTQDAAILEAAMLKLNQRAEILDSAVRDLSYHVHKELSPLLQRVESKLSWLDAQEEENRYLKSKKYKDKIIKEYTESLVTAKKD